MKRALANPLLKKAIFMEEKWEDILSKNGFHVDEPMSENVDWDETIYSNERYPGVYVLIKESPEGSFYEVKQGDVIVEHNTEPDILIDLLTNSEELVKREPVVHDKELNPEDKEELKSMGIIAKAGIIHTLDRFTRDYIECAMWSSNDNTGESLDSYDYTDIAPSTLETMIEDCREFQDQNATLLSRPEVQSPGHDFWLTRCGHGTGFWDRKYPKDLGDALTKAAKSFGDAELYVGDDGYIYQFGSEGGQLPPKTDFNSSPYDKQLMKDMGVQARKKQAVNPVTTQIINSTGEATEDPDSPLAVGDTHRTDALRIAHSKNAETWDYEANGSEVVLISPQAKAGYQTVTLEGDNAVEFWVALDAIEDKYENAQWDLAKEADYRKEIDALVQKFFLLMRPAPDAKVSMFMLALDGGKTASAPAYITSVTYDKHAVKKIAFSDDLQKAKHMSRPVANDIAKQLQAPAFGIQAKLVPVKK
jgi:hypothetical protein